MLRPFHLTLPLLLCAVFACSRPSAPAPAPAPAAVAGILDLRDFPFGERAASLDGEWEFHWQKFLLPAEQTPTEQYQTLPGIWQASRPLPGTGYASYRLKLLLPAGLSSLTLRVKHTETAYRLFANGLELGGAGIPAESAERSIPAWSLRVFPIQPSQQVDLVMHISNFHHARGGFGYSLELGTQEQIQDTRDRLLSRDALLFGALLIMSIYHFVIFALRRKDASPFWFAVVCAVIAFRVISTGDTLLELLAGPLPYDLHARIVYLSFYLAVPLFTAYLGSIFPALMPRIVQRGIWTLSLAQSAVVVVAEPLVFTRFIDYYYIFTAFTTLPMLWIITRALVRAADGSKPLVLGFVVLIGAYVNDVLYNKSMVNTGLYSPYAFIFFLVTQAYLLAKRFSSAFRLTETLSHNLEISNQGLRQLRDSLEERVQERTEALGQATASAEKSARAKTEFLALMSHEIRTPLNGIVGMLDLLDESHLDQEQQRFVSVISTSVNNLRTILNDILDFSKIESGKLELAMRDFSPGACMESALAVVSANARTLGLELQCHIAPDVPAFITGDEVRLQQVLLNLLSNAVKFTEHGVIGARLSVEGRDGVQYILGFEIEDTGIGIAEDSIPDLFQAFSQLESPQSARRGGTGLGLAISKRLVGLMGGDIGVQSSLGKGSTFFFTIRAAEGTASTAAAPSTLNRPHPIGDVSRLRLLVAEDNILNQEVITRILQRFGATPDLASNGQEALERIAANTYDAVFMDLEMPVMDGRTAVRLIRELPGPRLLIFALTAHALTGTKQELLAAGFDEYLSKPISKAEIGDSLSRIAAIKAQVRGDDS